MNPGTGISEALSAAKLSQEVAQGSRVCRLKGTERLWAQG